MADEKEAKIELERTYNIPLRKEFQKAPKYKRAKKAVGALKQFLMKHMKTEQIKVGKYLNLEIWKNGIKNPPHHVKIIAKKDSEGVVFAELEGAPEEKVKEEKKEKKTEEEKKEAEEEKKEVKDEKSETKKSEIKEETKEIKEEPKTEEKKTEVKEEKPMVEEEEETKEEKKTEPKEEKKEIKEEPKKESTVKKSIKETKSTEDKKE